MQGLEANTESLLCISSNNPGRNPLEKEAIVLAPRETVNAGNLSH